MRSLTIVPLFALGCAVEAEYGTIDSTPEYVAAETSTEGTEASTEDDTPSEASTNLAVPLKAGMFEIQFEPDTLNMGIEAGDADYDDYHLTHLVELTNQWSIGETEVTHGQWEAYMNYAIRGSFDEIMADDECLECPVHSVSWHQAQAFANAVSTASGLETCFECDGDGPDVRCMPILDPYECSGFRLPTEAEWEYAARGGEWFTYPGSDSIDEIAYWEENSGDRSYPVGSLLPNGFGLYDMGGNMRERVYDAFIPYSGHDEIDPVSMPDLDNPSEVFAERGGSYACRRPEIRWNRRNLVWDYERDIHTGFRLVRILD
jgi:formylglycine-generating enzyme required for sulfatase activity